MANKHLLAAKMARRYLFSRKSHSAVSIIAGVSICGVAVATLAIVCVLSVFNGFRDVISSRDSKVTPDIAVTAATAPCITNADSLAEVIAAVKGVKAVTPAVMENAVAYADFRQIPISLLGVKPESYKEITSIDSLILRGGRYDLSYQPDGIPVSAEALSEADTELIESTASEEFDEADLFADIAPDTPAEESGDEEIAVPHALLSPGVAGGLFGDFRTPPDESGVVIFVPRRTASLNVANPAAAFMADSLAVSGIFESEISEFDSQTVIVDLELARRLLEYTTEASAIYLSTAPGQTDAVVAELSKTLGKDYTVRDRLSQQTINFRMISIEKWVTFVLLSFILLIASFNIISTLSMLIVEKKQNLLTLGRIGASRQFLGEIFFWESIFVCIIGTIAGIICGVALCLLQQHFGLIHLNGDTETLIVKDYPVRVAFTDLLLILLPSIAIALITGLISSRFARRLVGSVNKKTTCA